MARERRFRFGVTASGAESPEAWLHSARRAEQLGYSTFVMPEHLHCFPPLSGMLAAAMATSTLHVGTLTFANDFWHPLWLARELAGIDFFSSGRLEIGIGTGWMYQDYHAGGIELRAPSVRIERLLEAIAVIKGLFQGGEFSFEGQHYTLRDVELKPQTVRGGHPPLLIGGGGKRMLGIAAREADIVGVNSRMTADGRFDTSSLEPSVFEQQVAWVQEAAGDRFSSLELNVLVNSVAVTENREEAAEELAAYWCNLGFILTADLLLRSPRALIGNVEQLVEQLQDMRERYHVSYIVIPQAHMEAFAPVVAYLTS